MATKKKKAGAITAPLRRGPGKPLARLPSQKVMPNRLTAIRVMKGWNREKAADSIGITSWALRLLESGEGFGLAMEYLLRIADVYGCTLDQVFGRKELGLERFASATPQVQTAQLNGIISQLARMALNADVLTYVDEIVAVLSHELPTGVALQSYRGKPAQQRIAVLTDITSALVRISEHPEVIKYLGALVRRFLQDPTKNTYTHSLERDEQAISHTLTNIDRIFGRVDPKTEQVLTRSRFRVPAEPAPARAIKKRKVSKSAKGKRKSSARKKK